MKTGKRSTQRAEAALHASQVVELGEPNWKVVESWLEAQEHHHGC